MANDRNDAAAIPIEDEETEQPIPLAWRPTLREIVRAFTMGDYRLACGVADVDPVSAQQADLWTEEEGRSDLVLSGSVSETADGYRFTLRLVYVP